jgi:bifunctional N-acetylglutamate synthase/kinase
MSQTKDVIVRLLRNLGSRKEVEQYLKQYSSVDSQKFAIIKAAGSILAKDLDALASSLTFLQRVGLHPIVLHGAGPQIDEALAEAGVPNERVDDQRVITPRLLEIARKVYLRENLRLVEALEELGTRARPVTAGVLEAKLVDVDRPGFVGEVDRVHVDAIRSSIRAGQLPIVACLGETTSGQIVSVNPDVAIRELALAIEPFKVIYLNESGGLLDEEKRLISAVNLAEDYDSLVAQPWLPTGASVFMTRPLWGVGSTAPYLHDGRATTLTEAILEHGGEAQATSTAFVALPLASQKAMIAFLDNLVLFKTPLP